jgi:DNA-binding MarR family transcriptional regulator
MNELSSHTRRRSAVLQAIEMFRRIGPSGGLNAAALFLYACENEGLTMSELADISRLPTASASRLIRKLARQDLPEDGDVELLDLRPSSVDRRVTEVFLSDRGRALRDSLDGVIAAATPIVSGNGELHAEAALDSFGA